MGRPDRMLRAERGEDPEFADDELLFLRITQEHVAADGERLEPRALPNVLKSPRFSVNRSKHDGEPEDVLWPEPDSSKDYSHCGVAEFMVVHVRSIGSTYVEHAPDPYNYEHSNVVSERSERNAVRGALYTHGRVRIAPPGP